MAGESRDSRVRGAAGDRPSGSYRFTFFDRDLERVGEVDLYAFACPPGMADGRDATSAQLVEQAERRADECPFQARERSAMDRLRFHAGEVFGSDESRAEYDAYLAWRQANPDAEANARKQAQARVVQQMSSAAASKQRQSAPRPQPAASPSRTIPSRQPVRPQPQPVASPETPRAPQKKRPSGCAFFIFVVVFIIVSFFVARGVSEWVDSQNSWSEYVFDIDEYEAPDHLDRSLGTVDEGVYSSEVLGIKIVPNDEVVLDPSTGEYDYEECSYRVKDDERGWGSWMTLEPREAIGEESFTKDIVESDLYKPEQIAGKTFYAMVVDDDDETMFHRYYLHENGETVLLWVCDYSDDGSDIGKLLATIEPLE